tara:strand:+ start:1265 stop:1900 length:636 start_codon:yes stop_codon:yes gene_type:complete
MADIGSLIKGMKGKGDDNSKIIKNLQDKGHSSEEIYGALDQGNASAGPDLEPPSPGGMETSSISSPSGTAPSAEPAPAQPQAPQDFMPEQPTSAPQNIPQRGNLEQIEEISEAIVEEKIQEFSSSIGDINVWKERTSAEIGAIKQEIIRLRNHVENLQITMAGKVETYNKSVTTMSSEMKALSKVMEKIMQPLTMNIKDLSKITEKFKKIK